MANKRKRAEVFRNRLAAERDNKVHDIAERVMIMRQMIEDIDRDLSGFWRLSG